MCSRMQSICIAFTYNLSITEVIRRPHSLQRSIQHDMCGMLSARRPCITIHIQIHANAWHQIEIKAFESQRVCQINLNLKRFRVSARNKFSAILYYFVFFSATRFKCEQNNLGAHTTIDMYDAERKINKKNEMPYFDFVFCVCFRFYYSVRIRVSVFISIPPQRQDKGKHLENILVRCSCTYNRRRITLGISYISCHLLRAYIRNYPIDLRQKTSCVSGNIQLRNSLYSLLFAISTIFMCSFVWFFFFLFICASVHFNSANERERPNQKNQNERKTFSIRFHLNANAKKKKTILNVKLKVNHL